MFFCRLRPFRRVLRGSEIQRGALYLGACESGGVAYFQTLGVAHRASGRVGGLLNARQFAGLNRDPGRLAVAALPERSSADGFTG